MYITQLAKVIARAGRPSIPGKFHIIFSISGKWDVVLHGTNRAIRSFVTRREAISYARQKAEAKQVNEIIVHDKTGLNSRSIYLSNVLSS